MNGKMWEHPATKENVETLKARGVEFIGRKKECFALRLRRHRAFVKVNDIAFRVEFLLARHDNLIA